MTAATTDTGEPIYTVTEAARLARVSVQALRQRISRGTLRTTRVLRDRRIVAGVPRSELARAYPELADAEPAALEQVLHGPVPGASGDERERARRLVQQLRRKLAKEREIRARLEGVVSDQERRLEELQTERSRLERRVDDLDSRLIFLDGGVDDDEPMATDWWRNPLVWVRSAVAAVVVATFFVAGGAYWEQLDRRFTAQAQRIDQLTSALGVEATSGAPGELGDR